MEFNRVLVPVIGTNADDETIKLACQLVKKSKSKGKIWAVYVLTLKRTLPIDAEIKSEISRAEEILEHAQEVAEDQDMEIETDLLQAREAGPSIVDEAAEYDIDVIVMGVEYKQHFGQFSMGSVVPYVLKNAPCNVILLHQYTETE